MSTRPDEFAARYAVAFGRYEDDPGERELSAAYELGRSAVREGLSVLVLAAAHHQALLDRLSPSAESRDVEHMMRAAGDFFVESLSAFEMAQRVLQKAREDADLERRQATLLRHLSTFLTDASIALDAAGSLEEVLRLVAEHAREITGAARCAVRVSIDDDSDHASMAVAEADAQEEPSYPKDFDALYAALAPPGSVRMTGLQLAQDPARRQLDDAGAGEISIRSWLAASLTALDGRDLGLIQVFDKQEAEFSELDEAVLVQLAQMASATVERAQLYRR